MFEAKLAKASLLKKILDSIKDLVTEANWDCSEDGMSLQAMDSSHVSLVTAKLNSDGFPKFRCDRNMILGLNLINLSKILKCSSNDDKVTLQAGYNSDSDKIKLIFESLSKFLFFFKFSFSNHFLFHQMNLKFLNMKSNL